MKIVCAKEVLVKAVNTVLKAVPSKTTMPILECILIETKDNRITFTANDMELGIETEVPGMILEAGRVALDAKIFSEIVRRLPENDVTISVDDGCIATITCEKAKFTISGKPGDDFAYLPQISRDRYISLSQFTLKDIIRQTIFSIADNDSNKMMAGELLEIRGNMLRIVSLDGHRVSIRKVELKDTYEDTKVVVPGKTLSEVSKILNGDIESEVLIFFTDNHILFSFDDTIVVSRLIEGEYFRIDSMLSGDYETMVKVNKRDLLNCIDRATLLVKESDKKPVILKITDSNMSLKLVSAIGSMDEDLYVEKTGRDIMIGFNPRFLIDALRVIDDEDVTLYMVNPKAPCFIRNEESTYIYLILPVNFVA